jgi:hypothetical protein
MKKRGLPQPAGFRSTGRTKTAFRFSRLADHVRVDAASMECDATSLPRLQHALETGAPMAVAVSSALGGLTLDGIVRFFGADCPPGGVDAWNRAAWRAEWALGGDVRCLGEDCFGNQLLCPSSDVVAWWNHETGDTYDLEVDVVTLVSVGIDSGVRWLDCYRDIDFSSVESLVKALSMREHLHWVTPLVLGGDRNATNLQAVERNAHMTGHAELWRKIGRLPPGTRVVPC